MQHQGSNFIITSECVSVGGFDIDKSGFLAHTRFRETLVDNLVVFVGAVKGGRWVPNGSKKRWSSGRKQWKPFESHMLVTY